jgi:O-antigen/teichoic acid export membrane protein
LGDEGFLEAQAAVAKRATSLYAANVVVLLANTLYFLILTNILKSTLSVGIVTALNLAISFLVTVCILAQPITAQSPIPAPLAVLKFVPELLAKGARTEAARIFRITLAASGIIAGLLAALLAVFPGFVVPLIGGQAVSPDFVRLAAVDVLFYSLCQVCFGALISIGDLRNATVYIITWSLTRYVLASILLIPYAILGVLVGWIIGDAVVMILVLRKSLHEVQGGKARSKGISTGLWKYSLYTLLSALIGFAVTQADKLFTLASRGLTELAVYNVAIVAASFTGFAPYALLTVLLPTLAALRSTGQTGKMRRMIRNYTRYVSIVVFPIAIGFASVAEVALRIFGPDYVVGLAPTMIVSVATGVTAVGAVYASALLATGELRWYTAANLLGLGALITVSAVSTGFLGLIGPALGRAALMAVAALAYAAALMRRGFLELDMKAYLSTLAASVLMGVVVFESVSNIHSFPLRLALLPLLIIIGGVIYLGTLRLLRLLTPADLKFVTGILPARLRPTILKIGRLLVVKPPR